MEQAAQNLMSGYDRDGYSFVLRVWQEKSGSGENADELRGLITHVQSGRRIFFRDFATLNAFLAEYVGEGKQQ